MKVKLMTLFLANFRGFPTQVVLDTKQAFCTQTAVHLNNE